MVAAQGLVDKGERRPRSFEEEDIVITANKTVEGCKLGWCQAVGVPGCDLSILLPGSLVSLRCTRRRSMAE